ncbi:ralBP1-associated Eps domain-containing protein 2 isoform X2 [Alligator mississippiensis]|uniref:ralBP1-associated Eps domain-containing protein 2 isoform X2 n=1 Tax=Alligator mississippiensis TaxID=8496 RepID=UPI0009072B44|nr:ralBP1-associated Eps domain-containing protein 2 isoform X2 [Alligator mississippiensis]
MEPGAAAAPALLLPLSEAEQQCYAELFARCRPGPAPEAAAGGSGVAELFRASQLPADALHQKKVGSRNETVPENGVPKRKCWNKLQKSKSSKITELCGAKRVGYFGPAQFYVALKLIAAAQSGLPVQLESIKSELPLPRFVALKNDSEMRYGTPAEIHGAKCQIPHTALDKNSFKRADEGDKLETKSPPMSPIGSPPASPSSYQRVPLSYGYSKSRSGHEQKHGASYESRHSAHQQDESAVGNYGAKSAHGQLSRSLSAEKEPQDSSSNYSDDPWRITEEQRDYYLNQFKTLQPDLNSFISGTVAKNFFTKSKLPIPELSHIWELSDVDCDGALTLAEFCAAFHLIVARKNGYPLPDKLPETLLPDYLQTASLKPIRDCALFDSYSESLPVSQQTRDFNRTELETVCEDPTNSEPLILFDVMTSVIEPKTSIEEVSDKSALIQAANSDDKQALKISTTAKTIPKEFQHLAVKTVAHETNTLKARPRSRSYSSTSIEDAMKKGEEPPTPPPRPQKSHSRASSLDLNKIFQQTTQAVRSGWLPPPPALPPRPFVSQVPLVANTEPATQPKSSYVDFRVPEQEGKMRPATLLPHNSAGRNWEAIYKTEQVSEIELHPQMNRVPPQIEESSPTKKEILPTQPPSKPIRRKFRPENQMLENQELSPTISVTSSLPAVKSHHPVQKQSSKQKRAIQTAIRKNKEANAVLARLNSELQQQLKEVHKERIALETQLEQLRPVTVL